MADILIAIEKWIEDRNQDLKTIELTVPIQQQVESNRKRRRRKKRLNK